MSLTIQRTKDRITLSSFQIEDILKDYIEKQTGRKLYGVVKLSAIAALDPRSAWVATAELQDQIIECRVEVKDATTK